MGPGPDGEDLGMVYQRRRSDGESLLGQSRIGLADVGGGGGPGEAASSADFIPACASSDFRDAPTMYVARHVASLTLCSLCIQNARRFSIKRRHAAACVSAGL